MKKIFKNLVVTIMLLWIFTGTVTAATEVQWWHAMGGQLGEMVDKFAADFNGANVFVRTTYCAPCDEEVSISYWSIKKSKCP